MFNVSQKEEFLKYAKNDYWKYVFAGTEDYEEEKGKDLCLMDTSELLHYLVSLKSLSYARTTRSRLSKYIDWCVIKGYAPMNWIAPSVISNDFLQDVYHKAKDEFYISKERYEEYMRKLRMSSYGAYLASFFSGLYEGFDYVELAQMRVSDIDTQKMRVRTGEAWREISEELVSLLLETAGMEIVESRSKAFHYRYGLYADSVWKSRKENISTESMVRQFRFLLDEAKKILGEERLTKTIIRNSGYFNRVYDSLVRDGIDVKSMKLDRNKEGFEKNRVYDQYFENAGLDHMDMRQFLRSFQSYIRQVE